ncbi:hypothetical protein SK128_020606, partial [Halocaridina rubra]
MHRKLSFPLLIETIYSNVFYFIVKSFHYPHLSLHYSYAIRNVLQLRLHKPYIQPNGTLIKTVSHILQQLDTTVPTAENSLEAPPLKLANPGIFFTFPPSLQGRPSCPTETASIESNSNSFFRRFYPTPIYTDGSLQLDGAAGSAIFSPETEAMEG